MAHCNDRECLATTTETEDRRGREVRVCACLCATCDPSGVDRRRPADYRQHDSDAGSEALRPASRAFEPAASESPPFIRGRDYVALVAIAAIALVGEPLRAALTLAFWIVLKVGVRAIASVIRTSRARTEAQRVDEKQLVAMSDDALDAEIERRERELRRRAKEKRLRELERRIERE